MKKQRKGGALPPLETIKQANDRRVQSGRNLVSHYLWLEEDGLETYGAQEAAVDCIANILHWAARYGLDVEAVQRMARDNFKAELEEEREAVRLRGAKGAA